MPCIRALRWTRADEKNDFDQVIAYRQTFLQAGQVESLWDAIKTVQPQSLQVCQMGHLPSRKTNSST